MYLKRISIILVLLSTFALSKANDSIFQDSIKGGDCGYVYSETLKKKLYIAYDDPPKLRDDRTIMDIVRKISIPISNRDENGEFIYIIPLTIIVFVDDDGDVLAYHLWGKRPNSYTAFDKIVIKAFESERKWIPAKCGGVNVASRLQIPLNINFRILDRDMNDKPKIRQQRDNSDLYLMK